MYTSTVSSLQNPMVKRVCALQQKASERKREKVFVVEGRREVGQCVAAGFEIETLFLCPPLAHAAPEGLSPHACIEVAPAVYAKMAYRGSTEGVLAVVREKTLVPDDLPHTEAPLYIVLESVEKPGNLGAVLRSADAAGADAVFVCDPLCDLGNPNLIRSSIGARFTVPLVSCTSAECIAFLKGRGVSILTAQLQDSKLYYSTDMLGPTAIVMGTESVGLTQQWREAADAHIRIPMLGRLDSLNVSVSAAVLLFEAVRQRAGQNV